jgi:hypothetical protein
MDGGKAIGNGWKATEPSGALSSSALACTEALDRRFTGD